MTDYVGLTLKENQSKKSSVLSFARQVSKILALK